jgi:predicted nucleic acid-binding protein
MMSGKLRIYIDTSVIGGYFDEEFEDDTKSFFERIYNEEFLIYLSEISETELSLASDFVKNLRLKIPVNCFKYLDLDEESKNLAQAFLNEKILGKASMNDAYHIAIATVNRLDVLVSWNFKHIVNFDKIQLFNSINLRMGYPMIDIRSPKEFVRYENNG